MEENHQRRRAASGQPICGLLNQVAAGIGLRDGDGIGVVD